MSPPQQDLADRNLHDDLRRLQNALLDAALPAEAAQRLAGEVARLRGMERRFSALLDQLRELRDELSIELASLERVFVETLRANEDRGGPPD